MQAGDELDGHGAECLCHQMTSIAQAAICILYMWSGQLRAPFWGGHSTLPAYSCCSHVLAQVTSVALRSRVSSSIKPQAWGTCYICATSDSSPQPAFVGSQKSVCCPGYYGHMCEMCPGKPGRWCSGNGECLDGIEGSGECQCLEGFHGTACEMCEVGRYGADCKSGDSNSYFATHVLLARGEKRAHNPHNRPTAGGPTRKGCGNECS